MFSRFIWYLNDEEIMKHFETTVKGVVLHCIVEKVDNFRVVVIRVCENGFFSGDQHDVVEKNVVPRIVPK